MFEAVSLIVRDKVTRQSPQITPQKNINRKKSGSGIKPRSFCLPTWLTPYRQATLAHSILCKTITELVLLLLVGSVVVVVVVAVVVVVVVVVVVAEITWSAIKHTNDPCSHCSKLQSTHTYSILPFTPQALFYGPPCLSVYGRPACLSMQPLFSWPYALRRT